MSVAVGESGAPLTNSKTGEVVSEAPPKPGKRRTVVLGVLLAVGAAVGAYTFSQRGFESTDDAQIDAEVVAVAGRTSGVVARVAFEPNDRVKAGQVLVELDDAPARARLAQAEAALAAAKATAEAAEAEARLAETNAHANKNVAAASLNAASAGAVGSRDQIAEAEARVTSAEASLAQATTDRDRTTKLVQAGSLSSAELDRARTSFDTAQASVAQARAHLSNLKSGAMQATSRVAEASAKVEQTREVDVVVAQASARARASRATAQQLEAQRDLAALDLGYTKIVASQDGVVSKKNVAVGQTLAAGSPFAMLVPSKAVWVTANFKETQIGKMRAGQPVEIGVDTFSGATLHGEVVSFSAATGSRFALLPPDNASGNFTKVVQRVPVTIKLVNVPESVVLRPGMSVDVKVDTKK